jgi:defect in organelle trafficking protein DotB
MIEAPTTAIEPLELSVGFSAAEFRNFIQKMESWGASDYKFQSNDFAWADINRRWQPVTNRRLQAQEIERILTFVSDQSSLGLISSGVAVDARVNMAHSPDDISEFRLNATGCMVNRISSGCSVTLRAIPKTIPSIRDLGLEAEIVDNLFPRYGLILIVGTTGSGKSTTLAAANKFRLEERLHDPVAILTYESPIEYSLGGLAKGNMPEPSQVDIGPGRHLKSFLDAGPNAMRRGDVIIMGEIRDLESAELGRELASTGHSVYATMHVDTPGECFDRLVNFFPSEVREGEASALLMRLRMVIAQKLAKRKDGKKIAFRSWIVLDRETKAQLSEVQPSKWPRIISGIVESRGNSFEDAAYEALKNGLISGETFREVAGFTPKEAHTFVIERGGDVSWMD